VSQSGSGEFNSPHPQQRYSQLRLDMSVTSEKDPRYAFTYLWRKGVKRSR
jgi:hypothetical protein